MHDKHLTLRLNSEAETTQLGAVIATGVVPGLRIWLEGDLGAGKTTLIRGLLRAAGECGAIKSPSYSLVEVHVISGLNFYHFDFYRFNQPEEYLDAGLEEYFSENACCLVEWPGNAEPYLPVPDLRIHLRVLGDRREAHLLASSEKGLQCLAVVMSSSLVPHA